MCGVIGVMMESALWASARNRWN